jgi:hypothetical protein
MSADGDDGGPGTREVAYRLFAAEFDDADYSYSESDEERAPNYVITPSGARVNRLFVVGVLTEVEEVSDDVLRGRVVDPTGAFVLYAGQYQPDEQAFLDRAEPPAFVAVTGKARTFQPEDSDAVYTSIRPESISTVDAETRDRWTVQTAQQTIERVTQMATALSLDVPREQLTDVLVDQGVDQSLAAGIPLAIDHYNTSPAYLAGLREMALDAARFVADEADEVEPVGIAPDAEGTADLATLADSSVDVAAVSAERAVDAGAETHEQAEETGATPSAADGATVETGPDAGETEAGDTTPAADTADAETTEPADTADVAESTEPAAPTETAEPESATAATEPAGSDGSDATAADVSEPGPESEPEPVESETGAVDAGQDEADDDIGDFEPGEFEPDEFELDEEEREEIEEEYGTEFQTGTEVDEPGSAGIETPDPEEQVEESAAETEAAAEPDPASAATGVAADETSDTAAETTETETEAPSETEVETTSEADGSEPPEEPSDVEPAEETASDDEATEGTSTDDEPAEDVDTEDAVIEVMEELDDGDGVDRGTLVDTVSERYGVSTDEVEDAIQEALMGGRCYEPDDATLKSI